MAPKPRNRPWKRPNGRKPPEGSAKEEKYQLVQLGKKEEKIINIAEEKERVLQGLMERFIEGLLREDAQEEEKMDDPFLHPNSQHRLNPPPPPSRPLLFRPTLSENSLPSLTTNTDTFLAKRTHLRTYHHLSPDSPSATPVPPQYTKPSIELEPEVTPRITLTRTRSILRAQAMPYVPASEHIHSPPPNTGAPNIHSLAPPPFELAQTAENHPQNYPSTSNTYPQRVTGASLVQHPVAGAMPDFNPWSVTANPTFNPSSSPWDTVVSTPNPATASGANPHTPKKGTSAAVNSPKMATPTPTIVTPQRVPSPQPEDHSGPQSGNWRSRPRTSRSRSPLSLRAETSNMPVPMLYHNMSRSPRRSTTPKSEKSGSPKPSVKHLTCWWWHEKGQCRYSDAECLYAHHETGWVADAPRQVRPGEPALAGKGLERALRRMASESGSLKSNINTPNPSRPNTPIQADSPPPALDLENKSLLASNAALRHENEILRDATKRLYLSHFRMINNCSQFRRTADDAHRQVKAIIAHSATIQCQPHFAVQGPASYRHAQQQRLQLQNQIEQIADVIAELEPKSLETASEEWAARTTMTQVVRNIEKANFGWDLAAAVAQDEYAEQMVAAAAAGIESAREAEATTIHLGEGLENLRL